MLAFIRPILAAPLIALFIGIGALLVSTPFAVKLFGNLRPDLEELLPTESRSVLDLEEVKHRLESIDNLAVLIISKKPDASRRLVDDLARLLMDAPKTIVAGVEYKIDKELKFFKDRRPLYMDLEDLVSIRTYIQKRIDYEKGLYNPLNIFSETKREEPKFDFSSLRKKYDAKVSSYARFPDGYYATPDESKRVLLVNLPGTAGGISGAKALRAYVDDLLLKLKPQSYDPDMQIFFTGGVQNSIEEQEALMEDLGLSTLIVTLLVSVAMFWFFKSFWETGALLFSLLAGTIITFGVSYFVVGYLNANSAFLGSIVIGNGINFGIILLARYLEEKRRYPTARAMRWIAVSISQTLRPTLTAALAAGLSYGSLMFTGFRGFKQFGVIGLMGMLICWICSYTLMPAYLLVREKYFRKPDLKIKSIYERPEKRSPLANILARTISKRPAFLLTFSIAVTFFSVGTLFVRLQGDWLETDLTKLRNKKSMTEGSGYLSKFVDEIFQRYLSPTVVLPHSPDDAKKIADKIKAIQKAQGPESLIKNVQTIWDFVPSFQAQKVAVLTDIRELLPPKLVQRLPEHERRLISELLTPQSTSLFTEGALPELVLSKFTERDGTLGNLVLVEPPVFTMNRDQLFSFVHEVRDAADSIVPHTAVAGGLVINSDLIEAVTRDGPRATLLAFASVTGLVILLFITNPGMMAMTLIALLTGVIWMLGWGAALGLKINFLNFIALPITFGIGVDYGVNILGRLKEEGPNQILRVLRETGGAVVLCSFTTIVGYSSLLIARNQAFVSFGSLAVMGELTCIFTAMVSLPAMIVFMAKKKA